MYTIPVGEKQLQKELEVKKICLVTGSRAEYGILRPLIERLVADSSLHLDIVATAMHLEEKYGFTYRLIEQDGFPIARLIPLNLVDTEKQTVVRAISTLQTELACFFEGNTYDLVIVLGDRYEMLAVVNVALIYQIPVCHLHGGEKTLGNFDEYIRHAITKMSHLHLVATREYQNRVIQMGENPSRVIHTGSLGVENALKLPSLPKEEILQRVGLVGGDDYYVVLFHPVTLEGEGELLAQTEALLLALEEWGASYVFIGSNSDTGSDKIMEAIDRFVATYPRAVRHSSLTTQEYHSLLRYSSGLVGNSSSGLIEVPSLQRPTLNIGNRQKGRLAGPSVIHVRPEKEAIVEGLQALCAVTDFTNPYWKEHATETAYQAICAYLKESTIEKDFYDIEGIR